ncbi:hypothetical protein GIB67_036365, partial [Kingdonia uniflora]
RNCCTFKQIRLLASTSDWKYSKPLRGGLLAVAPLYAHEELHTFKLKRTNHLQTHTHTESLLLLQIYIKGRGTKKHDLFGVIFPYSTSRSKKRERKRGKGEPMVEKRASLIPCGNKEKLFIATGIKLSTGRPKS